MDRAACCCTFPASPCCSCDDVSGNHSLSRLRPGRRPAETVAARGLGLLGILPVVAKEGFAARQAASHDLRGRGKVRAPGAPRICSAYICRAPASPAAAGDWFDLQFSRKRSCDDVSRGRN